MNKSKTRNQLVEMYISSLKENKIPWHKTWNTLSNRNGITNKDYQGVNGLLLSIVAEKNKYSDPRWFTYLQIKQNKWKLNNAKGKGVPIEFYSVYNFKTKQIWNLSDYEKYIKLNPDKKIEFRVISKITYVYNAFLIEGIPELKENINQQSICKSGYITNIIKNINVGYKEEGNNAYYNPLSDIVTLPKSNKFIDKYSYYATQLHELTHASGSEKRLNRLIKNSFGSKEYAREELIAEIASSFLMQKLNIKVSDEHYDNHKSYIKSWIEILEDKPEELFKAINEATKAFEYLDSNSRLKQKTKER